MWCKLSWIGKLEQKNERVTCRNGTNSIIVLLFEVASHRLTALTDMTPQQESGLTIYSCRENRRNSKRRCRTGQCVRMHSFRAEHVMYARNYVLRNAT